MPRAAIQINTPQDFADRFDVSRETIARLETYESLLQRWQKAVNLVAPSTLDQVWHRHFADSAQLLEIAPTARTWLDLGTGAGFPGMVIAILLANRSDSRVHLAESNARKCAFLKDVARQTGTAVEIHQTRIESLDSTDILSTPDIVTARALAALPKLMNHALPFIGPQTKALFLKGKSAAQEIEAARIDYDFEVETQPSLTDPAGVIVTVKSLSDKDET